MKAVRNSLILFAAGVALGGIAQAQDNSEFSHQGVGFQANSGIVLEMKTEPRLEWGSKIEMTGLFVDVVRPQATWSMLNPPEPARNRQTEFQFGLPPARLVPAMNDDLTVHEPDFALLRFSF